MIQINDKKYILTYLIGFILLATFLFSCNTHNHPKAQIILSILTVIGGIICIRYSIKNKDALHKTAFLIIIIFGLLTVFASPLLVAPDEVEHFARSDLTSEGGLIPNYHENQGYFINNYFHQMTYSQGSTLLDNTSFMHQDITHCKSFFTSVFSQNLFYVYLAQGFGIFIAKMLELPVIFALWLGRLCNLLLYSGIVYFAIKKTPAFKKELLVLSCLPIAVFQAASMSSDGIIFALAILNISYFIQMYKSEIIPNKNIIISSPAISGTKVYELINLLKEKQLSGVQITIVTWAPDSYGFGDAAYWMQLHEEMRKAGFYIKTVEESCERFAVIDQEVVWYGNINLLAKDKVDDSIMRVLSKEIASELMEITFGDNG